MLKQLSIFAENIKGKMQKVTGILLEEDINILGSVTNDSAEYGIIRMVVSKPEQALEALTKAGFICKLSDVLGIEVKDEVGNLNKLLLMYLDRFIHHADREKCLTEMSPESLRALASGDKKSKRFDIRLLSRETGFEWHESSCQVFEPSNGSGQTVLFKSRCINAHKRCTIVETAVKTEYDYVVYIEADTNSYILYTANYESGTLLPPVVGMDYTEEMIRFNTAHCPPGDREKLIAEIFWKNCQPPMNTSFIRRCMKMTGWPIKKSVSVFTTVHKTSFWPPAPTLPKSLTKDSRKNCFRMR